MFRGYRVYSVVVREFGLDLKDRNDKFWVQALGFGT